MVFSSFYILKEIQNDKDNINDNTLVKFIKSKLNKRNYNDTYLQSETIVKVI